MNENEFVNMSERSQLEFKKKSLKEDFRPNKNIFREFYFV